LPLAEARKELKAGNSVTTVITDGQKKNFETPPNNEIVPEICTHNYGTPQM
jgi:hypothetical protein